MRVSAEGKVTRRVTGGMEIPELKKFRENQLN